MMNRQQTTDNRQQTTSVRLNRNGIRHSAISWMPLLLIFFNFNLFAMTTPDIDCDDYAIDVEHVVHPNHAYGPDVECFELSFASGGDITKITGWDFGFMSNTGTEVHSIDYHSQLDLLTSLWQFPMQTGGTGGLGSYIFALDNGTGGNRINLTSYNSPFVTICIENISASSICLDPEDFSLFVDYESDPCLIELDNDVFCEEDPNAPLDCKDVELSLEYRGWSDNHHCFWFNFFDLNKLTNVTNINFQFDLNDMDMAGGTFTTPTFSAQLNTQTFQWATPATGSSTSGGTVATFSANKGTGSPAGPGDFSHNDKPYLIKLLVYDTDPLNKYCVEGSSGTVTFDIPDSPGFRTCDLDDLMEALEACTDDIIAPLDVNGYVRTHWSCLDAFPGIEDVTVTVENLTQLTSSTTQTNASGDYNVSITTDPSDHISITPTSSGDYLCGISSNDLSILQRHIAGITHQDKAWVLLAMDATYDFNIDIRDVLEIRKLLLGITSQTAAPAWMMVPEDDMEYYIANLPVTQISPTYDQSTEFFVGSTYNPNFWGVKTGDLDMDCTDCSQMRLSGANHPTLMSPGQLSSQLRNSFGMYTYEIWLPAETAIDILELSLNYEGALPKDIKVQVNQQDIEPTEAWSVDEVNKELKILFVDKNAVVESSKITRDQLVSIRTTDASFLQSLQLNKAESHDILRFEKRNWTISPFESLSLELYWAENVLYVFNPFDAGQFDLQIYDILGKNVLAQSYLLEKGKNEIELSYLESSGCHIINVSNQKEQGYLKIVN